METIILSTRAFGTFTDEEFYNFCQDNSERTFERDAKGKTTIVPNTEGTTGDRNAEITHQLRAWNNSTKLGKSFDSSTTFRLSNTAMRSPDTSWISHERWNGLTEKQQKQFSPLCPDFVVELKSETDSLKNLQAKLKEWMANGCRLGWLINPKMETNLRIPSGETGTNRTII